MSSFWDGFEKRAISLEALRRASNSLKKHIIKRRVLINPTKGSVEIAGRKARKHELSYGYVTAAPGFHPDKKIEGKILAKGDLSSGIRPLAKYHPALGNALPQKGIDKEVLNRVSHLHEGLERRLGGTKPNAPQWGAGHVSPKVVLKESNIAATLPKEHSKVKEFLSVTRGGEKDILSQNIPGFEYGKKRYSRHAIKRMAEILERRGAGVRPRE